MENKRERDRIKSQRQQQEDAAFVKVVLWFLGAVALMVLVWLADRYYVKLDLDMLDLAIALDTVIKALVFLGPVVAVLCGVLAFKLKRGKLALWAVAFFAVAVGVCSGAVWYLRAGGVSLLYVLVPAVAVLALIYYLYQREFFVVAAVSGVGLLGLRLITWQGAVGIRLYVFLVLLGLFLVAVAGFARYLQRREGTLTFRDKRFELLPHKTNYTLIYITCVLVAVVILAAMLLRGVGNPMTYYAVPVAWLLVMAVYYTVKLM